MERALYEITHFKGIQRATNANKSIHKHLNEMMSPRMSYTKLALMTISKTSSVLFGTLASHTMSVPLNWGPFHTR